MPKADIGATTQRFSSASWDALEVVPYAAWVSVWGRWFIWPVSVFNLALRPDRWSPADSEYVLLHVPLVTLNGLVHYRPKTNRPVTWRWMLVLSVMDLALNTARHCHRGETPSTEGCCTTVSKAHSLRRRGSSSEGKELPSSTFGTCSPRGAHAGIPRPVQVAVAGGDPLRAALAKAGPGPGWSPRPSSLPVSTPEPSRRESRSASDASLRNSPSTSSCPWPSLHLLHLRR